MQVVEYAQQETKCRIENDNRNTDEVELQKHNAEAAFYCIERMGFDVGQRYIQRILFESTESGNSTKSKHIIFPEAIDVVKFLCKEVWQSLFGKGIDNLKTNHRGVFVLQDNEFSWITTLSSLDSTSPEVAQTAVLVSYFFR